MLFAAGRGERLRPLTFHTPKPLTQIAGEHLLGRHLRLLRAAGFDSFVINVSWLAKQMQAALGPLIDSGWDIEVLEEKQPLGTLGSLRSAQPYLGDQPYAIISADIWTEYPYDALAQRCRSLESAGDLHAWMVLVPNPPRGKGDCDLNAQGRVVLSSDAPKPYTYSGLGVLHPQLVQALSQDLKNPLHLWQDMLMGAVVSGEVGGEIWRGRWHDIGTHWALAKTRSEIMPH